MASQPLSAEMMERRSNAVPWSEGRIYLILDDIAEGFTITAACKRAGVSTMTWSRWVREQPTLASAYSHAKAVGCDTLADECLAIADGALPGELDYRAQVDAQRVADMANGANNTGSAYVTRLLAGAGLEIARDRMRIDTRLKLLAQWDQRYSPKNSVELTGKDGGPIQLEDKGDAIALSQQLRDMKRARLSAAVGAVIEHKPDE